MGKRYLIDTNILIDAQIGHLPKKGMTFIAECIDSDFIVSFITYIEFLGYKNATERLREFISMANVLGINKNIIDEAIELRRENTIKLPDAIIASTAIVENLILVTRNVDDFKNIKNLELKNPWD